MDDNLNKCLEDYMDRSFIYILMLNRAEIFYNRMKMCFKMPIILVSSAMSIVNSNFDGDTMKTVNIVFNIVTSVILAVSSAWQLEAKQQEFCNAKKKFIKLSSEIEAKTLSKEVIEASFVQNIIDKYNNIEENLDYDIPAFILSSTRAKWATIKTLPMIINGVQKQTVQASIVP